MVDGPMLPFEPARRTDAPAAAREARFAGSSAGRQEVALYQGAPQINRVRAAYLRLEFYHGGQRGRAPR
jgi:hypothetical protein